LSAREPRPPAKLIAAASPGGALAVSANDAKPPAETPTAIMPLVETSVRLPMASTAARRSLADCQAERKYSRWPHGPLLSVYWPPESP